MEFKEIVFLRTLIIITGKSDEPWSTTTKSSQFYLNHNTKHKALYKLYSLQYPLY